MTTHLPGTSGQGVFSQIAFYYLKDRPTANKLKLSVLKKGIQELKKVYGIVRHRLSMKRYLYAFFFFSMGVQTVMLLAPLFGEKEVGMTADEMIIVVLILQVLAIGGAYLFAWVSQLKGNSFAISLTLFIWIFICVFGYFLQDKISFYGLVMILYVCQVPYRRKGNTIA